MQEEQKIRLSIISIEGDTLKELVPAEALEEIKTQVRDHGKWFTVDGEMVAVDELTEFDLMPERNYLLSNLLKGGMNEEEIMEQSIDLEEVDLEGVDLEEEAVPESTPYRTRFSFIETMLNDSVDAVINVDAAQKKINIHVAEDMSTVFVHNRQVLHNILLETLNNLALREVKNIQDRLDVGAPISIIERQHGMHASIELVDGLADDITITFNLEDNSVTIEIATERRFVVLNRRIFICHLLLEKLESAGYDTFNKMRQAVNV